MIKNSKKNRKFKSSLSASDVTASTLKWFFYVTLVFYCASLLIPIVWMLLTSFKTYIEYNENMFGFPKEFTFENFPSAFSKFNIEVIKNNVKVRYSIVDMIGTSFIWSFFTSLIHTFLTTTVAYVIARYKFVGSNFIYLLGIFVMITPIIGSTPSMMAVKKDLGIYNNMFLTILTQNSTSFSGAHFLIMYAAFKGIPKAYSEAAEIDGAGHFTTMFKVIIPMMIPTCAVIFVLSFLTHWNEYGSFLIWLPSYSNLAYGMYVFQKDATSYGVSIVEVMAGFCIAIIPSMTLYLSSQKLINSKFTVGGLKGWWRINY